ncbi:MAG: glucose-1-phosphate cytidylyltransferase [Planctomycetes bacterium RBG_13_62_9]|nr:MAG: glucose-1-phosphate cytidylyltransferase [Planctomycetes bacterium RBG_13_62_9]
MKVVILAGGFGTRLGAEGQLMPKPLVPIGGRPILWHIMKTYAHFGFTDFILCLGYKGEMVKRYFYEYEVINNDFSIELGSGKVTTHSNHSEDGWRVALVDTGLRTLKGARIKRVQDYIDGDRFMLTYGDGVADINLPDLLSFHEAQGKIGTVTAVRPPSRFGELVVQTNRVRLFTEKPQASAGLINGGFAVFDTQFLKYLSRDESCDLERGALEKLAAEGEPAAYEHPGQWACMDTLRDVEYLNTLWDEGRAFWKFWAEDGCTRVQPNELLSPHASPCGNWSGIY